MRAKFAVLLACLVQPCLAAVDDAALVLQAQTDGPLQATHPNARHYGAPWVWVGVKSQTLRLLDDWGRIQKEFTVSTAKNGVGETSGSYQTPRGWHAVCEKLGDGADENTIIFRRQVTPWKYTPELHAQYPNKDWILTRILWLCGQEAGLNQGGNVDSYDRAIYIHGAGDHVPWGRPSSLGCVRMKNRDVIELFDAVPNGTDVWIDENS
ncbi:L,D-transpeptidase [Chromobacterium violaceum]|uniref:L,D-transpeptidase n=1 Tax=Chromobacterium violaceum TaxID=536 RepID=UPI0009DB1E16|nr:L,D-transpeptidase [Chromobacterium violaceum]OQS10601.1 L,D-transpeptidase [Chromobacterium violaceum]OQS27031.1 L,D-transpeptidase [Chromobacterium violaceum]